jgi:hypothetical protein
MRRAEMCSQTSSAFLDPATSSFEVDGGEGEKERAGGEPTGAQQNAIAGTVLSEELARPAGT